MQAITLGTGSPLPDPNRAGPSSLVRAGGLDLLFDCGRGVLMRMAAVPTGMAGVAAVFLTHLHSDHVADLSDIIT
ncbi:MAG: MBL fold metallo-hydrolase, partial [Acidimicrobiales bacterium]